MEKPQVTVLENGLKVVTLKMPTLQTYCSLSTNTGSRHEAPAEQGITHYLEHILMSDTTKATSEEIDEQVQHMRGEANAFTSAESTQYFYRVANEYTPDAIELLADHILRPAMDPTRIEKERGAIQSEYEIRANENQRIRSRLMLETAFPGSGLDHLTLGTQENIGSFSQQDLNDYRGKHYTAERMVLTVVGDVDHEEIVKLAKQHVADIAPRDPNEAEQQIKPAVYRGGQRTQTSAEEQQVTIQIAFEAQDHDDTKTQAADDILAAIMGNGFSSRLMRNLRTEKSLVYSAGAGKRGFQDNGLFLVVAMGVNPDKDKVNGAVDGLCEEVVKLADTLTQKELDGMRNSLIGDIERGVENVTNVAVSLAQEMTLKGKFTSPEDTIAALQSVTLEDLQVRAREIFTGAPTVVAYGNGAEHVPSYEVITEKLGQRRELDASGLVKETAPAANRAVADAEVAAAPAVEKLRAVG